MAWRRQWRFNLFLSLAVLTLAVALMFLAVAVRREHHVIHSYNGTTWLDDQCYVDSEGTLWCQGPTA